ncbi:MAG: metal-dependent hydrolase [Flavobacteriales bacterium]|nr:metal-dependent hydrolase [Flavobacteriales bacterium]
MASAFGHAVAAIALGTSWSKSMRSGKFWLLGIACAILPDADVLAFALDIPYENFWGHRGFTHSLLFAMLVGGFVTTLFYRHHLLSLRGLGYIAFYFSCTASHSILDAMTTGGLGVAFFSPWDDTRYFFPWTPIKVSPIGISSFFSTRGLQVLSSELIWIGIPSIVYVGITTYLRRNQSELDQLG